jgi:Helix-turn-helix domain
MEAPTIGQLRSGPPTVSLLTAAAAIGIGRTKAYELAKRDEFPVAVRRVGATYRVPVAELLRFLQADETIGQAVPYPRESPHRNRR